MKSQAFILQAKPPLNIHLLLSGNISIEANILTIQYQALGELNKIIFPSGDNSSARQHKLWQQTCFEFFIGLKNSPQYWEFNLSPDNNWNVYRFTGYRQGMTEEAAIKSLPFSCQTKANSFCLDMKVDLNKLIQTGAALEIGIASVMQLTDNSLSYWAIQHCSEEADFHLRECFTIKLDT